MFRIGFGTDLHRLDPGKPLVLGGIMVPSDKGCLAYSDGDVIIHALCDAILGALSLGDIGTHFPDSDPLWKDSPSTVFLEEVDRMMHEAGFCVGNIDVTVDLEAPRLGNLTSDMRNHLATVLAISHDLVSIKAKTGEGLGPVGSGEAVHASAIVLLYSA